MRNCLESTGQNRQNSMYSGEKRNNSNNRKSRSVRFELQCEMKTADETITHVMDLEIKDQIITEKALLTRIRETSKPLVVEKIISETQTATIPIAKVNPVVIVDDQILFQTNATHASIENEYDIFAVIARSPEPIR